MNISNAVALVTGGASGLGRATVERLVAGGGKAVIVDLPGSPGAQVAQALGASARFAPADVRDEGAIQAAIDLASEFGDLRIAVNCAGTGDAVRTVGRDGTPCPLDRFQRIVDINLVGTFNVLRLAAASMARLNWDGEERGVIVNTASVAAFDGQVGQASYSASKGGVVGLTLPVARDLATLRIRVVTIAPGLFDTPILAGLSGEARASLEQQVPHPSRLGKPAEYAALVAHVIENPMVNGETVRLDGAIRMAPR
jgi:NAD(P)-dependent dehydrogenase (short-subunit alcohol dehydrogenase family)